MQVIISCRPVDESFTHEHDNWFLFDLIVWLLFIIPVELLLKQLLVMSRTRLASRHQVVFIWGCSAHATEAAWEAGTDSVLRAETVTVTSRGWQFLCSQRFFFLLFFFTPPPPLGTTAAHHTLTSGYPPQGPGGGRSTRRPVTKALQGKRRKHFRGKGGEIS